MTTKLREALQFYADRAHYHLDEWDSVSGEPPNWLHPPESSEDQPWMVEDGSIAREALSQPTSDEGTPTETPLTPDDYAHIVMMRSGMLDHLTEWYADNLRKAVADVIGQALHAKERELAKWKADAIGQNDIANRLFAEMEEAQRQLVTLQSVSAAPQVKHEVTCKLFPDPYDERDPVGPCTCRAAPLKPMRMGVHK